MRSRSERGLYMVERATREPRYLCVNIACNACWSAVVARRDRRPPNNAGQSVKKMPT